MTTGLFSTSLLEIEIQLDDLIQKAGGIDGVRLLDRLASLPEKERENLIHKFLQEIDTANSENLEQAQEGYDQTLQIRKPSHLGLFVIDGGLQTKTKRAG